MLIFLLLSAAFGVWVLPRLARGFSRLRISQGMLTLAIVLMIAYGLAAELIGGMAAITGTFLAGLFFSRTKEKEIFEAGMHALAYSFFVPIFFVSIGLTVNVRDVNASTIWILMLIIIAAIVGKIFGAGLGARLAGFASPRSTSARRRHGFPRRSRVDRGERGRKPGLTFAGYI